MRYNVDGTLDTSFGGGDGIVTTAIGSGDDEAHAVALQSDGRILVAGFTQNGLHQDFALVRYLADGTLAPALAAATASSPPTSAAAPATKPGAWSSRPTAGSSSAAPRPTISSCAIWPMTLPRHQFQR